MKRTREDWTELLSITLIVAVFCLFAQGTRLTEWGFGKPNLMFLRNPGIHVRIDRSLN